MWPFKNKIYYADEWEGLDASITTYTLYGVPDSYGVKVVLRNKKTGRLKLISIGNSYFPWARCETRADLAMKLLMKTGIQYAKDDKGYLLHLPKRPAK